MSSGSAHVQRASRLARLFALALLVCTAATTLTHAAETNTGDRNLFEEPTSTPDLGWPRIFSGNGRSFTVYQPQLDSWDGFTLESHAAVSLAAGTEEPPIFGVVNLKVRTLVDKTERLVSLEDLQIVDAKFPSAPEQEQAYTEALREVLPKNIKSVSLDRLEAQLDIQEAQTKSEALPLQNTPPRIVFMQNPSVLLYIDGEPQYVPIDGTKLTRVLNTRVLLLKDSKGKFYLHLLDGYMEASTLAGPWSVAKSPPKDAAKAEAAARELRQVDLLEGQEDPDTKRKPSLKSGAAPTIIVATVPTELIVTEGKPNYIPINGTSLLFVKNTSANVFKLLTDQLTYVLIGGRWFSAKSTEGPWEFVPPASLPKDFAQIPDDSPKENVKAAVPGTRQAQEALVANQIPTTARVERSTTKFTLQTDGEPKLVPITGTPLQYVLNASTPVIRVDDKSWYACQDGVWFVATSMSGPWQVADSVPAVIYSIPPSSPVYYVTYARVYQATPTYVYVGYTPGYMGAVVAPGGVVVYGTGYYYSPWVGRYWYGYPVTYGMGVGMVWTPWTGWAFGYGYGWPYYGPVWYRPPAPWWGPYYRYGYYPPGRVTAWGPGGWATTSGNIYGHRGGFSTVQRGAAGYNAFTGNQWATRYGTAYNSTTGTLITGKQGAVKNVYTGNYAYGKGGTATNTKTGASVTGGKVTVGNAYTGNSTTVGGISGSTPGGPTRSVVGAKGENGGVVAVGGPGDKQVYGTKDGEVYKRSDSGQWEQVTPPGGNRPTPYSNGNRPDLPSQGSNLGNRPSTPSQLPGGASTLPSQNYQDLNRQQQARDMGNQRANSFQQSRPSGGFQGGGAHRGGGGGGRRR